MKAKHSTSKTFFHTAIEVKVRDNREIKHLDLLEDIRKIELSDTCGRVYKYFKEDLIDGPDRFLVYVFETGKGFYKFDLIIRADDVDEFINHAGMLVRYVVAEDIEDQTVLTIV